jgi:hypothetical protein
MNILDESTEQNESDKDKPDDLDWVVRQIFEITSSPFWEDRAIEIAKLIKDYCRRPNA